MQDKKTRFQSCITGIKLKILSLVNAKDAHTPGTIFVLVSQDEGEGVSTVAALLAKSLAEYFPNQVALIDANTSNQPRLSSILNCSLQKKNSHINTGTSRNGFTIVELNSPIISQPSDNGEEWLVALRAEHRCLIVDAGTISSESGFFWLQAQNTHSILVIDANTTTESMLARLKQKLADLGIQLSGFILNKRPFFVPEFFYRHKF